MLLESSGNVALQQEAQAKLQEVRSIWPLP
jgi:hypothetical protein